MASKSSKELTKELTKPSQFVPRHGKGKLNAGGTLGHKGGSGRPPDVLKAFWASVLNGAASQDAVRKVLENPDHPAFVSLYAKVALHLVGVPTKPDNLNQDDDDVLVVLGV